MAQEAGRPGTRRPHQGRYGGWVGLPASGPFPGTELRPVWTDGSGGGSGLAQASSGSGCCPAGHCGTPADHASDQAQQQAGNHSNLRLGNGWDRAGWGLGGHVADNVGIWNDVAFPEPEQLHRGLGTLGLLDPQVAKPAVVLILDGGRSWLRGDGGGAGRGGKRDAYCQQSQQSKWSNHDVPSDTVAVGWVRRATHP